MGDRNQVRNRQWRRRRNSLAKAVKTQKIFREKKIEPYDRKKERYDTPLHTYEGVREEVDCEGGG